MTYEVGETTSKIFSPMFEEKKSTFEVIFAIFEVKKRRKPGGFLLVLQRYNIFARNPNLL